MRFLIVALSGACLVACTNSEHNPPEPTRPNTPTAVGVEVSSTFQSKLQTNRQAPTSRDRAGFDAFYLSPQALRAANPNDTALRPVFDETPWSCPAALAKDGRAPDPALPVLTSLVATANGRAYFVNRLCGAWSVSLQDPSQVEPLVSLVDATVSELPGDIAISPSGQALCVTTRNYEESSRVAIWSITPEGKPSKRIAGTVGDDCKEIVGDGFAGYIVVQGTLHRYEDGVLKAVPGIDPPESLQLGRSSLYYFDRYGLERLPINTAEPELVTSCGLNGGLDAPVCPAALVDGDDLYLARNVVGPDHRIQRGELVVRHEAGTFGEEQPVFTTASNESIVLTPGLARTTTKTSEYLWFVLGWSTEPGRSPLKTYVSRVGVK
ncbi:MAG: hypothetical protein U0270_32660 [Labilithrix sp.]